MAHYGILIFNGSRLVATDSVEADGHVGAIKACFGRARTNRVELWSDDVRVATLGPVSGRLEEDPILGPWPTAGSTGG
jgi:hypothetical protein